MPTGSKELWRRRNQAIQAEAAGLLSSGYVLTGRDVSALAAKHGYSPKTILNPSHFCRFVRQGEGYIGSVRVIEQRVRGTAIIRDTDLPLEETDFALVVQTLRNRKIQAVSLVNQNRSGVE